MGGLRGEGALNQVLEHPGGKPFCCLMQKAFVKYTLILGFLRGEALLLPYAKSFCKIYFDFGIFKGRSPFAALCKKLL
ncbi:hypothetical protein X929_01705 [Petrotoga olearia DSM 13574]|uniref:Uncharacterized protein n=1 Tax=Petrotoga olearia DSM 13574 TaxID=1122955 RepID=A0A2K1P5S1_9BACT|nr:hypothetical protein X929_01705 [Petrotoga olearia DSM 13574]